VFGFNIVKGDSLTETDFRFLKMLKRNFSVGFRRKQEATHFSPVAVLVLDALRLGSFATNL
jgi:hypothetical protein